MYKNFLLMRNGCEGCTTETCLGVLLAESFDARVTAVYVMEDFTWQELRHLYGLDELKWPGAARSGKQAKESAQTGKAALASKALESAKQMCASRGIPCETVRLSSPSPLHGVRKLAADRRCDVIVSCAHPKGAVNMLSHAKPGKRIGDAGIPVLIHHAL